MQAYLVLRGRGKGDDTTNTAKPQAAKFLSKAAKTSNSNVHRTASVGHHLNIPGLAGITDPDIQVMIHFFL